MRRSRFLMFLCLFTGLSASSFSQEDINDWSIEGKFDPHNPSGASGAFLSAGVGCYRKSFVLPDGSRGKRIKIRSHGAYCS